MIPCAASPGAATTEPAGFPKLMNFADFTELTKLTDKRLNSWGSSNSRKKRIKEDS